MKETMTILKPNVIIRRIKAGKMTDRIPGGKVFCAKCDKSIGGDTESPSFWENGSYCYCPHCKTDTLAKPVYPQCSEFPTGLTVDLTGDRVKYPLVAKINPDDFPII